LQHEDKCVDLYVLERAIISAHSTPEEEEDCAAGKDENVDEEEEGEQDEEAGEEGEEKGMKASAAPATASSSVDVASLDPNTAGGLFNLILASYISNLKEEDRADIARKYEVVRRRGRKRLAFG
jgi:tRNA A-37 threonylcarbamoyl transferase component Bud32